MRLPRTLAIALIAALGNPFCCCLTLFASEPTPVVAESEHPCCMAGSDASSPGSHGQNHDASTCPHQSEKESQISAADHALDTQVKPILPLLALLPLVEECNSLATQQWRVRFDAQLDSKPQAPPIAQSYCVYLL